MIPSNRPGARLELIVDEELRDVLRGFVAAHMGEEEIERMMKEPGELVDAWNDAHRLPAGEKTREEVLDFLVSISRGLERSFKEWHAEHGYYPDLSKIHDWGEWQKVSESGNSRGSD